MHTATASIAYGHSLAAASIPYGCSLHYMRSAPSIPCGCSLHRVRLQVMQELRPQLDEVLRLELECKEAELGLQLHGERCEATRAELAAVRARCHSKAYSKCSHGRCSRSSRQAGRAA